ncbi:UNVERIFIED_CONTAM: hypothetical protein FKN15_005105 [Acipenser sinensis]
MDSVKMESVQIKEEFPELELTRDANNMGNEELAKKNSRLARNLNHTGLGIGIAILILWIAYVAFAASKH